MGLSASLVQACRLGLYRPRFKSGQPHHQSFGEPFVAKEASPVKPDTTSNWQVRARTWEEFKRLVAEKKPKSIVYVLEQNGFSANREVTILKVIMLHEQRYYTFVDAPKAETLRETGIPLRADKNGARFLDDQEVKSYLKKQFESLNLEIYSFWTT
jgi:hypothetical protein